MARRRPTSACRCSSVPLQTRIEVIEGYPLSRTRDSRSEKDSNGRPPLPLLWRLPTRNKTLRRRRCRASSRRSNPSRTLWRRPGMSCQKLTRHARLQNNVQKRFETTSRSSGSAKQNHHRQIRLPSRHLQRPMIPRVHPSGVSNFGMEPRVLPSLPRHRYHHRRPHQFLRRFRHHSSHH